MENAKDIRSRNMAAIKGKDTKPEIVVRKYLWANGFRYRLNHPRLPGRPDVVLKKYRTCVFVNGCFWHGHEINVPFTIDDGQYLNVINSMDNDSIENSECCKIPQTNRVFWVKKILRNKQRDIEVQRKLADMGWHCITIWECELKPKVRQLTLERLAFTLNKIYLNDRSLHKRMTYQLSDNEVVMAAEEKIKN